MMLTRTERGRVAVAVIMSASVIGLSCSGAHHHPHQLPPATETTVAGISIAYPTSTPIPQATAEAIGEARASSAIGCPSHKATAWAEVDERGTVLGIHAACIEGP